MFHMSTHVENFKHLFKIVQMCPKNKKTGVHVSRVEISKIESF